VDVHVFVFFFWQTYKMFITYEGHSRYTIPWSPTRVFPFYYNSSYHNYHHSKNIGNYSTAFYPVELLFGTNKTFFDEEFAKAAIKQE
jgi:sterol desaturase/sphingolipid hydroxylase (fatty acid hydroxylase superfamily)